MNGIEKLMSGFSKARSLCLKELHMGIDRNILSRTSRFRDSIRRWAKPENLKPMKLKSGD